MERTVFLKGDFMPESEARLPIFDRGLLFADSVYEGFGILDGQIVDFIYHMQRLEQSLAKIAIPITFTTDSIRFRIAGCGGPVRAPGRDGLSLLYRQYCTCIYTYICRQYSISLKYARVCTLINCVLYRLINCVL